MVYQELELNFIRKRWTPKSFVRSFFTDPNPLAYGSRIPGPEETVSLELTDRTPALKVNLTLLTLGRLKDNLAQFRALMHDDSRLRLLLSWTWLYWANTPPITEPGHYHTLYTVPVLVYALRLMTKSSLGLVLFDQLLCAGLIRHTFESYTHELFHI